MKNLNSTDLSGENLVGVNLQNLRFDDVDLPSWWEPT
jgi:uncharacterized protein YjbI with pentapeptide repeats